MIASELLKKVNLAAAVVNPSVLVPIAKNLYVFGSEIHATDLQTSIVVKTPFTLSNKKVAVDTQKLVAILKALGGEDVTVEFDFPVTKITSSSGEYEIASVDGADFPPIVIPDTVNEGNSYLFQRAIELTQGSVSTDELRPVMTGVYFDSALGNVVSTNGHKLSRYEAKFDESFILPPAAFKLIKNVEGEKLYYGVSENLIGFSDNDVSFSVRKIDGKYPPYDKVIPQGNSKIFTIDQAELLNAVKRVALFASQESSSIILELGEENIIKGQDINYGNKAEESLGGDYLGDLEIKIALNAKYLVDLLNTSGEGTLTITMSESNKPVLISNSNNPRYLQLIMPVNL